MALLEVDVNVHKSNSTFFLDADVSRAELLSRQFAQALVDVAREGPGATSSPGLPVLAGTQATFLRELRPFAPYNVVSRLLAWDDAALHVVTYFVKPGTCIDGQQEGVVGPAEVLRSDSLRRATFAILVSRYVVRAGRRKIVPADLLRAAGALPADGKESEAVEEARASGLEYIKSCAL